MAASCQGRQITRRLSCLHLPDPVMHAWDNFLADHCAPYCFHQPPRQRPLTSRQGLVRPYLALFGLIWPEKALTCLANLYPCPGSSLTGGILAMDAVLSGPVVVLRGIPGHRRGGHLRRHGLLQRCQHALRRNPALRSPRSSSFLFALLLDAFVSLPSLKTFQEETESDHRPGPRSD